jgi:hypothetical protein
LSLSKSAQMSSKRDRRKNEVDERARADGCRLDRSASKGTATV